MQLPIILASSSPRRHQLLKDAGVAFSVQVSDIDETRHLDESALTYIHRMVRTKADKAVSDLLTQNVAANGLVLTADTIGVLTDGTVLTKPMNKADAFGMWERLSDDEHQIWTAVCATVVIDGVIHHQKTIECATKVRFIKLNAVCMERYWATGEPADKAGAYAIQGGAAAWVDSIDGSYTNVVGLPLAQTMKLIGEAMQTV